MFAAGGGERLARERAALERRAGDLRTGQDTCPYGEIQVTPEAAQLPRPYAATPGRVHRRPSIVI
jgi:hypothetical protein